VDVVALADTTVVLLAPGMGDGIQAAKAGILEIADVFVVNKADRDGADQTVRDLRHALSLGRRELGPSWRQPIVRTVATTGEGADELVTALDGHHEWLVARDELEARRIRRASREIEAIAVASLRARLGGVRGGEALAGLAKQVAAGETDPYTAADKRTGGL
jgi:LAO/AO transport system kinase